MTTTTKTQYADGTEVRPGDSMIDRRTGDLVEYRYTTTTAGRFPTAAVAVLRVDHNTADTVLLAPSRIGVQVVTA